MKSISLPQLDIQKSVSVCPPCFNKEMKRRNRKKEQENMKKQINEEREKLNELFMELHKAYENDDEEKAIEIKSKIDVIREALIEREQKELERQLRKEKSKEKETKQPLDENKTSEQKVVSGTKKKSVKESKKKKIDKVPDNEESIKKKLDEKCSLPFEKVFHEPNDGKCCLVLDIDYTLFDHRWYQQVREDLKNEKSLIPEFKRPYLHEFLTTCYEKYDIIIWSATSMTAIDSKCSNLGIYSNENYKVNLVLSKDHMIYIYKQGKKSVYHETVKPLEVIWRNFPQYTKKNTIHIDDLKSNFQLNPSNGLLIHPFKEASKNNDDTELIYLTKYLLLIANNEEDFSKLNHYKWKEYTISKLWEKQNELKVPEFVEEKSRMKEIIKSSNDTVNNENKEIKIEREEGKEDDDNNNCESINSDKIIKKIEQLTLPDTNQEKESNIDNNNVIINPIVENETEQKTSIDLL